MANQKLVKRYFTSKQKEKIPSLECPQCGDKRLLLEALEASERVRCRSCGGEFTVPVFCDFFLWK